MLLAQDQVPFLLAPKICTNGGGVTNFTGGAVNNVGGSTFSDRVAFFPSSAIPSAFY